MRLCMTLSPSKKPATKQAAFTFVEILVTVSVMVISLSIGAANYLRFLDKQKLYQAGAGVESMLKDARLKAQNGFLGSEELGFCAQLAAVEVLSSQTAENKVKFTAQLHCASDYLLVYDSYTIEESGTTLSQNFQVAFLPVKGATLLLNGAAVASGSATLARDSGGVTFNLDQGGIVDVQYH